MHAHTSVRMVLCTHTSTITGNVFFSPTLAIVGEISIAPTASFHWICPRHTEAEKRNKTQGEKKRKSSMLGRETDGTGANIAHKEAKQRSQCQAHGGACARAEIFRRIKTVVALRLHIHHRGDCCVCPKEKALRV